MKALHILCLNGVNLDLLGTREPEIYGRTSLAQINDTLQKDLKSWANILPVQLEFQQTNDESRFLEFISETKADGIMLNPGAWTHTSLALADRLKAVSKPYVEIHLSNLHARAKHEPFRLQSYSAPGALGIIQGLGVESYRCGLLALMLKLPTLPK